VSFLNPLYHAVAVLLNGIHDALRHVIPNHGWAWAMSIVVLTICMRLVLFPVFVKQIRSQRAMQALQPKMKELQAKYKNDKEKLNQEMMALWKEAGTNPLSGCLPLLLQIPIFIALFHTLREIKPAAGCNPNLASCYHSVPGFSSAQIYSAAHAKIFGVPIPASFFSSQSYLHALGASQVNTRILCIAMTIVMSATTFLTQRQLMARNTVDPGSSMAQQQKIMLYIFPALFLFWGLKFPIGVLLYWLTTNLWSMAQQRVVIARMDRTATAEGPSTTPAGPAPGAKPVRGKPGALPPAANLTPDPPAPDPPASNPPTKPAPGATPRGGKSAPPTAPTGNGEVVLPPGGAIGQPGTPAPRPPSAQRPARRSKNRKKGRR